MKKYLVIAGRIPSKYDGDIHKISCSQLVALYGVDPKECIFVDEDRPDTFKFIKEKLVILRPRYDCDYREYLEDIS